MYEITLGTLAHRRWNARNGPFVLLVTPLLIVDEVMAPLCPMYAVPFDGGPIEVLMGPLEEPPFNEVGLSVQPQVPTPEEVLVYMSYITTYFAYCRAVMGRRWWSTCRDNFDDLQGIIAKGLPNEGPTGFGMFGMVEATLVEMLARRLQWELGLLHTPHAEDVRHGHHVFMGDGWRHDPSRRCSLTGDFSCIR